jgi:ABC-2 type transport system permease protein
MSSLTWMAYALRCLTEAVVDWRSAVQRLLFQPLVYLLVFGGVLGGTKLGGGDYAQVVAPGIVAIVVMNSAMAVVGGMFVTGYYFHAMEAWLLGPITLRGFLSALVAGATAMAMLAGTTALVLIRLVLGLSPAEPVLALAAIVFGAVAFSLLFVMAFALPRTPDRAQSVLAFVMMPMMFFGCTFYSWDSLAWPWNALALLMPTTYLSEALRATYGSSASLHASPWLLAGAIAILGGLAVLSDVVFKRRFRDFPW